MKITIETVDEITNQIMDELRERYAINSESDEDDELYTIIHNIVREQILK